MPSIIDQAKAAEERKLRMAGLNPDGSPIDDDTGNQPDPDDVGNQPDPDDDDDDDDQDLAARLQRMEQNFQALHGRVAPMQHQNEELRELWNNERNAREAERVKHQREMEELRAELENREAKDFDLSDVLSPEEIEELDPKVLQVMTKLVTSAAKKMTPKTPNTKAEVLRVLNEQRAEEVNRYRRGILTDPKRGIHTLGELAYNPKFAEWAKETGLESVVASLMSAQSTEEVDRHTKIVANRLAEWGKTRGRKDPPSNARPSMSSQMRRRPQPKLSQQEVDAKLREVKSLARSRNPADRERADQLLRELESNT